MTATVRSSLERSQRAKLAASLSLGAGGDVAIWENQNDRVSYHAPQGHVFSLYLKGGTGTRRLDAGGKAGRQGAVCIMPEGQTSEWEISTPFRFVHFYVSDHTLRSAFSAAHDCDSRRLDLPEVTFNDMPLLSPALCALARATETGDILMADAAVGELVMALGSRAIMLRGGLSLHLLRRIDDWIDANLDKTIRLDDLAQIVALSPFHLHRMFRASRGITLHSWIMRKRIERAKVMLLMSVPLIEIAVACGFSNHSHFTRSFKSQTALTPAAYRAAVRIRKIVISSM